MSSELGALLEHCGLESRWLNVLNDLGIETYDELQSKINDGGLHTDLYKEAKDEEKEALESLLSKDCKQQKEVRSFKIHLEDNGLDASTCSLFFAEEGIFTLEHLSKVSGNLEVYGKLVQRMNDVESIAVQQMMKIAPGTAAEEEIKCTLNGIGLESKYWFPIFKDKLGVSHPTMLKYIDSSDCQILKSYVRIENEGTLIEQYFKHVSDAPYSDRRQNDKAISSKRFQEINRVMKELQELSSIRQEVDNEGNINVHQKKQKLQDLEIKMKIENLRSLFQMPRTEFTESITIDILKQMQKLNQENMLKDDLKDMEVVENASDGLLLKGILLTKENEEKLLPRKRVLMTPSGFCLSKPTLRYRKCYHQFTSQKELDFFSTALKTNGYSITVSDRVENEATNKRGHAVTTDEDVFENHSGTFCMQYAMIPIAGGTFEVDKLFLSKDALKELKKLEEVAETLSNDLLFEKCESFFNEFGTHINTGQMHFGGIYLWQLSYEGKLIKSKEMLNKVANDAMEEFVSSDYRYSSKENVSVNDLSENFKKKYSEFYTENVKLSVEIVGGPPNAASFAQWKSGLTGDNSSWVVIDRGFNVKGVWELLENHEDYFNNHSKMAKILCSAWEVKTGLSAGQIPNFKQLVEVPQRIRELCSSVESSISDPVFSKNCENYLEFINTEKDQITVISRNPNMWQSVVKENPCILNFLEIVGQNKDKYSKHNIRTIKFLCQLLIRGMKMFVLSDAIIQWMSTSDTLSGSQMSRCVSIMLHFISALKRYIIPRLNVVSERQGKACIQAADDGHCISATNDFAAYVSGILDDLHGSGEHHFAYLITLLLIDFGYNMKSKCFDIWLSGQDLDIYLNNLEENWKNFVKYGGQSVNKVECYLLHVALEVMKQHPADFSIGHKISQMINLMKSNFSIQVNQMIDQYATAQDRWDKLESAVQSVLFGTPQEENTHSLLCTGLEKVMQMTPVAKELHEAPELHTPNITVEDMEKNDEASVLEILGLTDYYPCKITLQHVMQTSGDKLNTMCDIPWYIIHKLLMLDYRGRNIDCLSGDKTDKKSTSRECESKIQVDNGTVDDDFVNDIFAEIITSPTKNAVTTMPHPMDVLVAIFLCSSHFLRQILAEKMYMCHVSIPILLPSMDSDKLTYLLWPLRNIICECELSDGTAVETPIVSYYLPIVSFLKLGEVPRSKSKLLNDVISSEGHNTFFHKDCVSDVVHPKISNGMADVAWLLPSKQSKSKLNDAVTFINLHGNGNLFPLQCQFLSAISNVVVVLVCLEELQNSKTISVVKGIINTDKKLVLIISKTLDSPIENFKDSLKMCLKEVGQNLKNQIIILDFNSDGPKSGSKMRNEVLDGILNCLSGKKKFSLEEGKKLAESLSFKVDENNSKCVAGQLYAKEVFIHVDENNLAETKAEMLPLQGDLWHKWGVLEKREHRKEGKAQSSEHYIADLHEEKLTLRRKQLLIFTSPPRLLESFLSKLLQLEGSVRLYYLRWLTIYFDGTSRKALPNLIKDYRAKWTEINCYKSKQKDDNDPYMMTLQNELSKMEEKLAMTSLGLEHMMREVGQAFEAVSGVSEQETHGFRNTIHKLPRAMAELMLSGYPLEIMDGDASHVPLSWVTAVLSELKLLVGDKRVFVLSVLGVQSSGKSTLLNTMFGLQFAVSAGRCTRGVYAQLVPVPKSESDAVYDYILVVDTEGLRAPELGSTKHQHDNELATLVIGLGDMTIINIKGENPTEMQDVLQIVVHAFLRMQLVNKNVKLQPSCFFIHQNVGAVNAAGKMIFGQQKLQDNLDQITVAAADQENVRGIYSFKEVIDFDVEKNVWYFSDLWQGDPPMAPANPGYSEKVREVRMSILNEIMQKKKSRSNLSTICIRIKDLWKGILAENFVFSFKNSLELRAYGSLETTLADLSWSLQNEALKWLNSECNKIFSCEKALDVLEVSLTCEFSTHLNKIYDVAQNRLASFFEESDDKDVIEQWKEKSMLKLRERKEETFRTTMNSMKNEIEVRKLELHQISKTETYNEDIKSRAKKLALELQGTENISVEELDKEFMNMWTEWMKSLSSEQHYHQSSCDIERTVQTSMYESLHYCSGLLSSELKKSKLSNPIKVMKDNFSVSRDHIALKKKYLFWNAASESQCSEISHEMIWGLFDDIEEYVKGLEGSNFCSTQAATVIKKTLDVVKKPKHVQLPFNFTANFRVQLVVFVCRYAVFKFKEIHHKYLYDTDPRTIIERNYRDQLLKLFKSTYKKSEKEGTVADVLSTCLMKVINKAVSVDMPRELAADVRSNVPNLHTKGELLKCVLRDLLKLDSFEEYHLYLTNIKCSLRKWLRNYTNGYVFERRENGMSRYAELASLKICLHIQNVCREIERATAHVKQEVDQGNGFHEVSIFQEWIRVFLSGVTKKLPLTGSSLSLISEEQIEDIESFKENLMKRMTCVQLKLENMAKSVTELDLEMSKTSVYNLLEKECLGCCEQCPFCNAPCSLTIAEHDVQHSALQHYPQGCGRFRWVRSGELIIDNCSTLVCGDKRFQNNDTQWKWELYKDYKKFYPDWKIQADSSMETSLYWKRFMAKFKKELAKAYEAKVPNVPHAWTVITRTEAEASLE